MLIVNLAGRMETRAAVTLEQKINQTIDAGEKKTLMQSSLVD
ncbi:MAG: hypothetical protein ACP5I1_16540 [Candidatus Hinthialibacter sp.]